MNLIEDSFETKKEDKSKKIAKVVLIIIILLVIVIISIICAIVYIQSNTLQLILDGQKNDKVKELLLFEDGKLYIPIRDIAQYLGYESFNGEYNNKSEDKSKCYVQSENEIANFSLNSKKIYKLDLNKNNNNYDYYTIDEPVKARNGVLYTTIEGIETAFNVSFQYDEEAKRITIYTIPYLIDSYKNVILDYNYIGISDEFDNNRAILSSMIVVKNDKNKYGVISLQGDTILEPKYDRILYLPNTGDFLITNNSKVGIMSNKSETKIQTIYDSIELIDSESNLYIVKKDSQYGVVDIKGNVKIYIEYDKIGIDSSKFEKNDIKNGYLLVDNLIPVCKDNLWGLYDKNGKLVVDFEYDDLGYMASSNKEAINLLVIPNYNVIVAKKEDKYTLVNSSGKQLVNPILDDVYMTINSEGTHYYMTYNDKKIDVTKYLDSQGIVAKDEEGEIINSNTVNTNKSINNTANITDTNSVQDENKDEIDEDNNNENEE